MTKRQKRSLPARPPLTEARHSILLIEPGPFPSSTLTRLRRVERRSLSLVPIERPAKQRDRIRAVLFENSYPSAEPRRLIAYDALSICCVILRDRLR